jgi:transposase
MTIPIDDLVPDDLWALVMPLLPVPPRPPYGGRHRTIPDRNCFAAIVYMARTSTPWRLLPARELGCGSPATCWRRLTEWAEAGCSTPSTSRSWTGWASRVGWTGRGPVWTP